MKILRMLVAVALLMASISAVPKHAAHAAIPKHVAIPKWVIYLDPHPDDEVLTFGVPILNDLRAGKKVKIVLFSYGEHSFAREVINGKYDKESIHYWQAGQKVYCPIHHKYHDPKKENYKPMTVETFGKEREKELYRAAKALGIPEEDIEVYHLPNDGFKYRDVEAIVKTYVKKYPDAEFKTMSRTDAHPDHAMIGKVVDDYYDKHIIKKKTNYLSIFTDRMTRKHIQGYKVYLNDKHDKSRILAAINEYKFWNPQKGVFGLGYHGVPTQFNLLQKNIYTTVVPY
jgi:LmbE family N-acetylglucosaminyl deacetylase